jgi:hypothetical protein
MTSTPDVTSVIAKVAPGAPRCDECGWECQMAGARIVALWAALREVAADARAAAN